MLAAALGVNSQRAGVSTGRTGFAGVLVGAGVGGVTWTAGLQAETSATSAQRGERGIGA